MYLSCLEQKTVDEASVVGLVTRCDPQR